MIGAKQPRGQGEGLPLDPEVFPPSLGHFASPPRLGGEILVPRILGGRGTMSGMRFHKLEYEYALKF